MANERELVRAQANEVDLSLGGVLSLLTKRSARSDEHYNPVGRLTNEELLTLSGQLTALREASINGLRTFGELLSSLSNTKIDLDANGVGWLVAHLAENVYAVVDIGWSVDDELANRGLNSNGFPLRWRA